MSVTDFLADLGQTLPEGAVITDMARRTAQSRDVFIGTGRVVAAVVRPTDLKDVQTLAACAKRHGCWLPGRNGGCCLPWCCAVQIANSALAGTLLRQVALLVAAHVVV